MGLVNWYALRCASEMGLGTLDFSSLRIKEVAV